LIWAWRGFDYRNWEFILGVLLMMRGVIWKQSPDSMSAPVYDVFIWGSEVWGPVFFVLGALQIAAVWANGSFRRSPQVRLVVSMSSMALFLTLGLGFWGQSIAAQQAASGQLLFAAMCAWCALHNAWTMTRKGAM